MPFCYRLSNSIMSIKSKHEVNVSSVRPLDTLFCYTDFTDGYYETYRYKGSDNTPIAYDNEIFVSLYYDPDSRLFNGKVNITIHNQRTGEKYSLDTQINLNRHKIEDARKILNYMSVSFVSFKNVTIIVCTYYNKYHSKTSDYIIKVYSEGKVTFYQHFELIPAYYSSNHEYADNIATLAFLYGYMLHTNTNEPAASEINEGLDKILLYKSKVQEKKTRDSLLIKGHILETNSLFYVYHKAVLKNTLFLGYIHTFDSRIIRCLGFLANLKDALPANVLKNINKKHNDRVLANYIIPDDIFPLDFNADRVLSGFDYDIKVSKCKQYILEIINLESVVIFKVQRIDKDRLVPIEYNGEYLANSVMLDSNGEVRSYWSLIKEKIMYIAFYSQRYVTLKFVVIHLDRVDNDNEMYYREIYDEEYFEDEYVICFTAYKEKKKFLLIDKQSGNKISVAADDIVYDSSQNVLRVIEEKDNEALSKLYRIDFTAGTIELISDFFIDEAPTKISARKHLGKYFIDLANKVILVSGSKGLLYRIETISSNQYYEIIGIYFMLNPIIYKGLYIIEVRVSLRKYDKPFLSILQSIVLLLYEDEGQTYLITGAFLGHISTGNKIFMLIDTAGSYVEGSKLSLSGILENCLRLSNKNTPRNNIKIMIYDLETRKYIILPFSTDYLFVINGRKTYKIGTESKELKETLYDPVKLTDRHTLLVVDDRIHIVTGVVSRFRNKKDAFNVLYSPEYKRTIISTAENVKIMIKHQTEYNRYVIISKR